jgi:hypothetical protein
MAKNEFVCTPTEKIASPPKGNKGGPGTYDGDDQAPFSQYRRTKSADAVPEKLYDGSVPGVDKPVIMPDKLPKNMGGKE